ncbi:hypothetical protein SKAU_G00143880 [Synaphobranchus kaupii]|uniref:Uncharacterized protein n=1 Tax=Synaphobranchus kaupii TaxID=118154 RepID=A0A9Q1FSW7_SYNKA|nr:hypothetical protein SKAU_G00143880 [Synaphobranchus kaupii]
MRGERSLRSVSRVLPAAGQAGWLEVPWGWSQAVPQSMRRGRRGGNPSPAGPRPQCPAPPHAAPGMLLKRFGTHLPLTPEFYRAEPTPAPARSSGLHRVRPVPALR